jgi:diguanylate cyclase (GGDEF)-like protein
MLPNETATTAVPPVELEKPVILVVDDSAMMRRALQRILDEEFSIIEAKDGVEAWNIIQREHGVQVVFTDLMMPNKNGFQLLRDIRDSVHTRINQLPVIILTGHEDDETMKRRAMSLGASDFISKPFDPIQILARARSYAQHGETMKKLEQTRQLLASRSTIDSLTGLGNDRYLAEHGAELMAFAARQGADISVLRLSIDKFEVLVRKAGQAVGDKVLSNVARIIRACARREDVVARVGTAEFVVVMPGADAKGARKLADRVLSLINQTVYRLGKSRFRMTASAGLLHNASVAEGTGDFDAALAQATELLRRAVEDGGRKLVMESVEVAGEAASMSLDQVLALVRAGREEEALEALPAWLPQLSPLLDLLGRAPDAALAEGARALLRTVADHSGRTSRET